MRSDRLGCLIYPHNKCGCEWERQRKGRSSSSNRSWAVSPSPLTSWMPAGSRPPWAINQGALPCQTVSPCLTAPPVKPGPIGLGRGPAPHPGRDTPPVTVRGERCISTKCASSLVHTTTSACALPRRLGPSTRPSLAAREGHVVPDLEVNSLCNCEAGLLLVLYFLCANVCLTLS